MATSPIADIYIFCPSVQTDSDPLQHVGDRLQPVQLPCNQKWSPRGWECSMLLVIERHIPPKKQCYHQATADDPYVIRMLSCIYCCMTEPLVKYYKYSHSHFLTSVLLFVFVDSFTVQSWWTVVSEADSVSVDSTGCHRILMHPTRFLINYSASCWYEHITLWELSVGFTHPLVSL